MVNLVEGVPVFAETVTGTCTVPFMPNARCEVQTYGYVPATAKARVKSRPPTTTPVFHSAPPKLWSVVVWPPVWKCHLTEVPSLILTVAGVNVRSPNPPLPAVTSVGATALGEALAPSVPTASTEAATSTTPPNKNDPLIRLNVGRPPGTVR